MATNQQTALATAQQQTMQTSPVITEMAALYKMTPGSFIGTVKETLMPNQQASASQILAFLTVAQQFHLNPFTRQIFAFPAKGGGIVPMVPVDGWVQLVQSHPAFNGMEFGCFWEDGTEGMVPKTKGAKISAISCKLHRKDMELPIVVTEFLSECARPTEPWQKWPIRMLRHKSLIQCARIAFGFSGIYDEDEAERIAEAGGTVIPPAVGPMIDSTTGNVTVPNMTKNAAADLKQNLDAARQKAAQPAQPATKPAPTPAPTPQKPQPPTIEAEFEEQAPPDNGWDEEQEQEAEQEGDDEQTQVVDYSQAPSPDPTVAPADGGGESAWGTVTAVFAPTKAKSGNEKMGLKLGDLNLSDWHVSHHPYLKGARGKVCLFTISTNGSYKNVEKIHRIGEAHYECDDQGHCVPVIQVDRGPKQDTHGATGVF